MRRSVFILLFFSVCCLAGMAAAQETAYNEARALLEYEANTVDIASRYGSSVVEVSVVSVRPATATRAETRALSSGSGFLIHLSGRPYIVTSYHVLRATEQLDDSAEAARSDTVKLEVAFSTTFSTTKSNSNGEARAALPVRLRYVLPDWDLALLEPLKNADVPDVPPIPLGDSESLRLGQKVIFIGSPFGLTRSVTTGAVSALNRHLPGVYPTMIQTDAAINRGSSGGPLLTAAGEVVGVATAIYNPSGDTFAGVSLAVPIKPLLEGLAGLELFPTSSQRPTSDITVVDVRELPRSVQVLYGVPDEGLLVQSVAPGGAAAQAGLQGGSRSVVYGDSLWRVGGDVIVGVREVALTAQQSADPRASGNGKLCAVTVVRSGQNISLLVPQVALSEREQPLCSASAR